MPFAATWMELEIIILSKSERERQMSYNITYMYNLKYDTNYLSMKQKQTYRTDLWFEIGREGVAEGQSGSLVLADANYYIWNG